MLTTPAESSPQPKGRCKMKLKYFFLTLAGIAAFAVSAHADNVDFTMTNAFYHNTWTFSLPESPTPDIVLYPSAFQLLSVPVSMNGAPSVPKLIIFTLGNLYFACGDFAGPGVSAHITSCAWDPSSPTFTGLFTGTASNPTFVPGDYPSVLAESQSDGQAFEFFGPPTPQLSITEVEKKKVPEPSS